MPRTGSRAARAGSEVPPRTLLNRTLLGEAVRSPATKPSGMRASTFAEIRPSNNDAGRTRQRSESALKLPAAQLAALPDHNVPATPANVTPGGANQRSAVPAGNMASMNARYAPTPNAHHDQRLTDSKPSQQQLAVHETGLARATERRRLDVDTVGAVDRKSV